MTMHVISDLRRDLHKFVALAKDGLLGPETLKAWEDRLGRRIDDVDAYLVQARLSEDVEQFELTDLSRQYIQPGRRTARTRHLSVVDGGGR